MKLYRFFVSFAAALAAVFAAGYLSGILVNPLDSWLLSLKLPVFAAPKAAYEIGFIICYCLFIITATLSIYRKHLRKSIFLWGILLVLNIFWCVAFFVLHLALLGVAVIFIELIVLGTMIKYYLKYTPEMWLLPSLIFLWYAYMFIINYGIVMLN